MTVLLIKCIKMISDLQVLSLMHILVDINVTRRNLILHVNIIVSGAYNVNAILWTASDIYKQWQ